MDKPKIKIIEYTHTCCTINDCPCNTETYDIWAIIEMQSEKTNLRVEFPLEALVIDWDYNKIQSYAYLNSLLKWEKIAKANNFDFEIESQLQPKDAPITL